METYTALGTLKYLGTCDICKASSVRTYLVRDKDKNHIDICPVCYNQQLDFDINMAKMEDIL